MAGGLALAEVLFPSSAELADSRTKERLSCHREAFCNTVNMIIKIQYFEQCCGSGSWSESIRIQTICLSGARSGSENSIRWSGDLGAGGSRSKISENNYPPLSKPALHNLLIKPLWNYNIFIYLIQLKMGFSLSRGYSRTKRKEKLSLKYVREKKSGLGTGIWFRIRKTFFGSTSLPCIWDFFKQTNLIS